MTDEGPTADAAPASASQLIRRQRVFLISVGTIAVLAVAALVASLFVKSPAQRAAEAAPPTPSTLTAAVEKKVLTQSVVVRGEVASPGNVSVSGTLGASDGPLIVTKLPVKPGAGVQNGQLIAEISGRPLLAFAGDVPAYRDITVGTTGDDARQLQADLVALGYLPSSASGDKFTVAASRALRAFMKKAGYATELDGSGYPMLRLCNAVFLPTLPATVASVGATVGANLSGAQQPLLSITTGRLSVSATVPQGSQTGLKAGQHVAIADDVRGRTTAGTIASIGAFSTGAAAAGSATSERASGAGAVPGYPVVVQPDAPLSGDWLGANVKLTVVTGTTTEPVLVVPVAAISTTADGQASVTVLTPTGARERIPVTVGLISAGVAAVRAQSSSTLKAGARVVLG